MKTELYLTFLLAGALAIAQTPASGPLMRFTATTDNISDAHDSIRIDLLRWSTDAERDQFLAAWNLTAPAAAEPEAGGRGGRGGRGGGQTAPAEGAAEGNAAAAGRGGGRGGRGGRGGGAPAAPRTPESSLAAALAKAPTVGYLWSSEAAGYAVRYAAHFDEPGGGQRVILLTDRRLGTWNDLWKLVGPDANGPKNDYEFSLIELHLNSKWEGEGKVSLTGKVTVDDAAKTIALEDFATAPLVLKNVRRKTS
jgi:hypothetical protein